MWCKHQKYGRPSSPERFDQSRELQKLIIDQNNSLFEILDAEDLLILDSQGISLKDKVDVNWFGLLSRLSVEIIKVIGHQEISLNVLLQQILDIVFIPGFNHRHSLKIGFSYIAIDQDSKCIYIPCKQNVDADWAYIKNYSSKDELLQWVKSMKFEKIQPVIQESFQNYLTSQDQNSADSRCENLHPQSDRQFQILKKPIAMFIQIQQEVFL